MLYLLIGSLLAAVLSFGGGWHYGSKDVAQENATLTEKLKTATDSNEKLAASIATTKIDCKKALDALTVDVTKRKAALKAAKKAGADAEAVQRGTINGLRYQAITAKDAESNCAEAAKVLNKLAEDRQ